MKVVVFVHSGTNREESLREEKDILILCRRRVCNDFHKLRSDKILREKKIFRKWRLVLLLK